MNVHTALGGRENLTETNPKNYQKKEIVKLLKRKLRDAKWLQGRKTLPNMKKVHNILTYTTAYSRHTSLHRKMF